MIGVIVPAHNEEACLAQCLKSIEIAARHPALGGERVETVVVLDACNDGSARVASGFGCCLIHIDAGNVGAARAAGADTLLQSGARWLAFTDADSFVAADWLVAQLSLRSDLVCGTVSVADWSEFAPSLRERYESLYVDADGHRHVHGANFGISSAAYRQAGGFEALAVHEDVALVDAGAAAGLSICWSAMPRVTTSGRRAARVRGGFADYLLSLELAQPACL